VFGLRNPSASLPWMSLNNSIAVTEFYTVGFDSTTGFACGGCQDAGTPVQDAYGTWRDLPQDGADGGLAAVGVDGTYYYTVNGSVRRSAAAWNPEGDRGGILTTSPAACTWAPGRVDAFYAGQNSHLWHRWFEGDWHAEEDLGGVLTSGPAACTWGPGRVDIFYRGQNNHLWHRWFDGGWQPEEDLDSVMTSGPDACTWYPGRIDLFYRGQNMALWHRSFERPGAAGTPAGIPTARSHGCVVNPVDSKRLLVAGDGHILESFDQGDTVRDITPAGLTGEVSALAYGRNDSNVAYVGTSTSQLFLRKSGAGLLLVHNYPVNGGRVDDISVDATDWRTAAVISSNGLVSLTRDGGEHWSDIRGNIGAVLQLMRSIVLVKVDDDVVVLVAGDPQPGHSGVVRTINPHPSQSAPNVVWMDFGSGLPRAQVFDLLYVPAVRLQNGKPSGDLVLAGMLGRGIWAVEEATKP
jgi:hypothetical protein